MELLQEVERQEGEEGVLSGRDPVVGIAQVGGQEMRRGGGGVQGNVPGGRLQGGLGGGQGRKQLFQHLK